ncbi:hypothetical protein [Mycolicibacterium conceptionense]|uniref:hypothetical protein n=1 Tax=Mycolicibacterium conceptionense TaxID=451644 RepID=UPI00096D3240|nr:hypothetical protein [Mycolicibacterium conceptionense]OMB79247.1 hypothetical protein A5743_14170 [Mycolicibacterium conceptionense]
MIATTLSFTERYDEMHAIGLPDWQIAKRMGITLSSLERELARYDRPVSDLLRDMAREERNHDE